MVNNAILLTKFRGLFKTLYNMQDKNFEKQVSDFHSLRTFRKNIILDVWEGSEYASEIFYHQFKI